MRFLQISDTHFLQDYSQNHDLFEEAFLHMTSPLEKLTHIAETLKGSPLDFICHCGDVVHSGTREDYVAMKEKLQSLFPEVPILATCGNRDQRNLLEEVFWGTHTGVYLKEFPQMNVISFDNADGTPLGEMREDICQKVHALVKDSEKPCLLFCHHNFIPEQTGARGSVKEGERFDAILQEKNVLALLTGHTHHRYQGEYQGIPYYTVAPLSFVALPQEEEGEAVYDKGGYHLFSYEEGVLTLEQVGKLPYEQRIGTTQMK